MKSHTIMASSMNDKEKKPCVTCACRGTCAWAKDSIVDRSAAKCETCGCRWCGKQATNEESYDHGKLDGLELAEGIVSEWCGVYSEEYKGILEALRDEARKVREATVEGSTPSGSTEVELA